MKKLRWLSVLLAIVVLMGSFAFRSDRAYACSCAMPESVEKAKNNSHAVFEGTVTERKERGGLFTKSSADPVEYTFRVHRVWKGKVASTIEVVSSADEASCGFEFKDGLKYVVFAYTTGDQLEVSLCSRTAEASTASAVIGELEQLGHSSVPPVPQAGEASSKVSLWWIAAITLLAGAILFLLVMMIRRRKIR
ncbi:hypothetical protein [Paenibacillus chungangensis]|uniref:Tissue inhibitor of metalloproteinase n=1 Tax=Paenibacillus chungangensis TaxID=696535 RepID=A0ABW3HPZ7_9BACL